MAQPNAVFSLGGSPPNFTFPLPLSTTDPDDEPLVYVRLNQEWLKYLIGACYALRQEATWLSDDYSLVCLSIARANLLLDMLMTVLCDPVCIEGIRLAGSTLQISDDGGETWANVGNAGEAGEPADPRTDEPLRPARTGSNIPCLAAANATAVFVELHRELSVWYNTLPSVLNIIYSIGAGLQVFFAALWQQFGIAVDVDTLAVDVLAHSDSLNDAAFTAGIQSELTCILSCRADSSGRWSAEAITGVMDDIALKSGDMWRLLEVYLEEIAGYAGLNNAGTTTSVASYSCESCECNWCYEFNSTSGLDDWTLVASEGTWAGTYWNTTDQYAYGGARRMLFITYTWDSREITSIDLLVDYVKGTFPLATTPIVIYDQDSNVLKSWTDAELSTGDNQVFSWDGSETLTGIKVFVESSVDYSAPYVYDGSAHLKAITLHGAAGNPIGDDNCI